MSDCSCYKCVKACQTNPGWMAPEDARKAIDAGLAPKLMRDWLYPSSRLGNKERIFVLAPASVGYEGRDAPTIAEMSGGGSFLDIIIGGLSGRGKGACVMLDDRRCTLHDSGFKPKQCRETLVCSDDGGIDNYDMARLWDNDEARVLVKHWMTLVDHDGEDPE